MSLVERVLYFHQEARKGNFPNGGTLGDRFEASIATVRRDMSYLRDRLLAPLGFDRKSNPGDGRPLFA